MSSGSIVPEGQRASEAPRDPSPIAGRTSLGKYQVLRELGAGGMGTVYLAVDSHLKRTVALKVLHKERASNETLVLRFEAEARAAAQLKNENIVTVYDAGQIEGHLFIALEFVDGTDIHELVAKRGIIPLKRSVGFIKQVAKALDHLHKQGIVHRDIKPSNLLLTKEGIVKLTDLGLARAVDESLASNITREGTTVGTVDYMSPEQARNSQAADIRSDIYSLGCTWYQMLTGEPPYPEGSVTNKLYAHISKARPDPRAFNHTVPEEIVAVMHKMMARKVDDRYQNPSELINDLDNLGSGYKQLEEVLGAAAEENFPSAPDSAFAAPRGPLRCRCLPGNHAACRAKPSRRGTIARRRSGRSPNAGCQPDNCRRRLEAFRCLRGNRLLRRDPGSRRVSNPTLRPDRCPFPVDKHRRPLVNCPRPATSVQRIGNFSATTRAFPRSAQPIAELPRGAVAAALFRTSQSERPEVPDCRWVSCPHLTNGSRWPKKSARSWLPWRRSDFWVGSHLPIGSLAARTGPRLPTTRLIPRPQRRRRRPEPMTTNRPRRPANRRRAKRPRTRTKNRAAPAKRTSRSSWRRQKSRTGTNSVPAPFRGGPPNERSFPAGSTSCGIRGERTQRPPSGSKRSPSAASAKNRRPRRQIYPMRSPVSRTRGE